MFQNKGIAFALRLMCATFATSSMLVVSALGNDAMAMPDGTSPGQTTVMASNTITVTGVAGMTVPGNTAVVNVNINVEDSSMKLVLQDQKQLTQKLTTVVKRFSSQNWTSPGPYNYGNTPNAQVNVTVTMPNNAKVNELVDAIASITPSSIQNEYSSVQYVPENLQAIRSTLFSAALADAKEQAVRLAGDAGDSVGGVISMSANSQNNGVVYYAGPVPSNPTLGGIQLAYSGNNGTTTLTAQVTVTFQLLSQ